ncbi:MAG: Kae1-like domain-containing protein [Kofleriaceae bacterium]
MEGVLDGELARREPGAIPLWVRRARGAVPAVVELPVTGPPVLAVGSGRRTAICVAHDGHAAIGRQLGVLDELGDAIDQLCDLLGRAPEVVAHDLHPGDRSTRWARASGLARIAVPHHHAHVAACLAEHGRPERVLGVVLDGPGIGDDGAQWGGEQVEADLISAHRVGHLRPLALAGGEAALREPWRLAAAALDDAGASLELVPWSAGGRHPDLDELSARRIRAALAGDPARTTSAGCWFAAVAALLGAARPRDLEALADRAAPPGRSIEVAPFACPIGHGAPFEIDLRPVILAIAGELARGAPAALSAARFHATIAWAIRDACRRASGSRVTPTVVLTGGCAQNRWLIDRATALLEADGFEVLVHRRVPPGDGGLALGQAAVASARLAGRRARCP